MKKIKKIIIVIIVAVVLVGAAIGIYFVMTKDKNTNSVANKIENETSNLSREENGIKIEENKVENKVENTAEEKVLYTYSSADNAAAKGHPEILYIYSMNDKEIKFKYASGWNENNIGGVAKNNGKGVYIYENNTKKVELELNSLGEGSIKVTEYENGTLLSWKNLFTDGIKKPNKNEQEKTSNENSNVLNMEGHYIFEDETSNYYHRSEVNLNDQTENSIKFSINAAHGNDVNHVNVGKLSGEARKIDVPEERKVPESTQVAFKYTDVIDGKTNEIIFVCTKHRQFQYLDVIEKYATENNPYAGNRVFFAGEYEFTK